MVLVGNSQYVILANVMTLEILSKPILHGMERANPPFASHNTWHYLWGSPPCEVSMGDAIFQYLLAYAVWVDEISIPFWCGFDSMRLLQALEQVDQPLWCHRLFFLQECLEIVPTVQVDSRCLLGCHTTFSSVHFWQATQNFYESACLLLDHSGCKDHEAALVGEPAQSLLPPVKSAIVATVALVLCCRRFETTQSARCGVAKWPCAGWVCTACGVANRQWQCGILWGTT